MTTMTHEISNYDDVIDSRDVIARIEELNALAADDESELTDEESRELVTLQALADEASQYAEDWAYGETLIRDSYFTKYAQQYADDVIDMQGASQWPFVHIDWEAAAADLQQDYTSVDFDGVTYWVR